MRYNLQKGMISINGQVEILDCDSLCYVVKNTSKGATGVRTISKALLNEYVDYYEKNPTKGADDARRALAGLTEIDKFEYGYSSTLMIMAKMVLGEQLKPKDMAQAAQSSAVTQFSKDPASNVYLRAMRTKPFLLLAGISGTGKSGIVKQMAFDSCPDIPQLRQDPTSPGNYCLIEVKPNWHDSTELLGYESKINGDTYQLTHFVKFLVKAMMYPEVPFFVCLDEMNLAPVEQYLAEFLSVLESRTKINGRIVSEPLIPADIFRTYELRQNLFPAKKIIAAHNSGQTSEYEGDLDKKERDVYELLQQQGLRIPQNLVVIGTVNMDETTHQFSRKVIDRAMTIEMNLPEGDPFMDFFNKPSELAYVSNPTHPMLYLPSQTRGYDALEKLSSAAPDKAEWLKEQVVTFLTELNDALAGTPFKVAYRVQNELLLYFYQVWREDKKGKWSEILRTACDQILVMKVLPRVEGDDMLLKKPLERLGNFCRPYPEAMKKIQEMTDRLNQSQFTSFWP